MLLKYKPCARIFHVRTRKRPGPSVARGTETEQNSVAAKSVNCNNNKAIKFDLMQQAE